MYIEQVLQTPIFEKESVCKHVSKIKKEIMCRSTQVDMYYAQLTTNMSKHVSGHKLEKVSRR